MKKLLFIVLAVVLLSCEQQNENVYKIEATPGAGTFTIQAGGTSKTFYSLPWDGEKFDFASKTILDKPYVSEWEGEKSVYVQFYSATYIINLRVYKNGYLIHSEDGYKVTWINE